MAIIGFDDQTQRPEGESKPLSSEETAKLLNSIEQARKNLYLSPERLAKMEATYGVTVVHDFNDEYHLTDEEREAQNNYYKLFSRLNKCKRKYRKINEFVDCARISLQCLQAVAENNTVYSVDEFMSKAMKEKLVVNGWFYPRYNGRDRKQISWDYISEFILTDRPSEELLKQNSNENEFLTDEERLNRVDDLFDEGEFEKLFEPVSEEQAFKEDYHVIDIDEEDMFDYPSTAIIASKDDTKSFIKQAPELLVLIKELRREMKSEDQLRRFVSDIRLDDIEAIEDYDNKRGFISDSDIPEFKGDITSSKDYHKYMRALEMYERTQIKENYAGQMRTREEINELKLKEALESAGWNIRVLYDNKEREKKLKRAAKADKAREKRLKEQLTKVQNRSKRRMGMEEDDIVSSKKKKNKKKKKKSEDD